MPLFDDYKQHTGKINGVLIQFGVMVGASVAVTIAETIKHS